MITLLLHQLRLLPFLCGAHRQLALENLASRHQLSVYKRTTTRPKLRTADQLVWIGLTRLWAGWRQSLMFVTPDTVLRWQRRLFPEYRAQFSGRTTGGRPAINAEIRALIARMAKPNPPRGAPRIHGELANLGIQVAERTMSRLIRHARPVAPRQSYRGKGVAKEPIAICSAYAAR
jgi:hypothetical protein